MATVSARSRARNFSSTSFSYSPVISTLRYMAWQGAALRRVTQHDAGRRQHRHVHRHVEAPDAAEVAGEVPTRERRHHGEVVGDRIAAAYRVGPVGVEQPATGAR